ncbi:MAG TPA: hypothetical protein VF338_07610 [Leptolinea sp.]
MKAHWTKFIVIVLLFCLALPGCGTASVPPTTVNVPPQQPTNTLLAPTAEVATVGPAQTPVPTEIPTATATAVPTTIQHLTKPPEPAYIPEQNNIDCTLGTTTGDNSNVKIPPSCDNPALSYVERPVTSDTKAYLPYLDIGQTHFGGNIDWIFASEDIYAAEPPTGSGDVYYFFKLDLNYDGRNTNVILISVKNLPLDNVNWTVSGVQAWHEVDGTVSTIFDQGVGADPDMVWARRSPNAIELAFKPSILNGPERFAWEAWSYQGSLLPADIALKTYTPDVYQIDNTCAWGFNVSAFGLANHCIRN